MSIFGIDAISLFIKNCTTAQQGQLQVIWNYEDDDDKPDLEFYPDSGHNVRWTECRAFQNVIKRVSSFREELKEIKAAALAVPVPTPLETWNAWVQDEIPVSFLSGTLKRAMFMCGVRCFRSRQRTTPSWIRRARLGLCSSLRRPMAYYI